MARKEDSIPATLRAVSVLEALVAAERPAALAELTGMVRLPKPTLYRMLGMLEAAGLGIPQPGARTHAPAIHDRRQLAVELARIRGNRYAPDREECHAGLVCVAVPVADRRKRACAALAVQAPVSRMPLERALGHLPALRQAASAMAETFF